MKVWIYLDKRQQGPFEPEELVGMPGFDQNTRVWFEGLPKWYPAGSLEQLRPLFDGTYRAGQPFESSEGEHNAARPDEGNALGSEGGSGHESEVSSHDAPYAATQPTKPNRYAPGYVPDKSERPSEPCPPTYLGWSVFLLVCCCSPISLAAVAASIFVSSYYSNGRIEQARKASEVAAWLVMISFALGIIPLVLMSALFN